MAARTAALWLLGALACTASHAQVHRCTNAQGHITYTNAPCAAGEAAVLVQPALSAQEREQQQAQHAQALQQRQAQRAAQAQKDAAAQAERAHHDSLRASQAAQAAAERAQQAQAAAQAAADQASRDAAERAGAPIVRPAWGLHGPAARPPGHPHPHHPPRPHPHPAPPPPHSDSGSSGTWSCNVFRCTDGQGNTRPVP